MQFNFGLLSAVSMALLLSPAAALDATFYSAQGCTSSGTVYTMYGMSQNSCHALPFAAGSVGINGYSPGSKFQGYTNSGCTQYLTEFAWVGCLSGNTVGWGMRSANWFFPSKRLVRKEEPTEERFSITYDLQDSTRREIEVPFKDVEHAIKLADAKDYEALAKFPTFVKA